MDVRRRDDHPAHVAVGSLGGVVGGVLSGRLTRRIAGTRRLLSVAAGILPLADGGLFQLSRSVTGAEAIDAISGLERLFNASK